MRRLISTFLVLTILTGILGITGLAGEATDYFRVLAVFFTLLLVCSLAPGRRRAA